MRILTTAFNLEGEIMPAYARRQIVDESQVGVYHCVSRCVRRAFLCGDDHYSGKNFDHRKVWVQERIETLAGIMGVDVLGFSVMSNHIHLLLRIRPDVAASWTDEEVARRWWRLHPGRRDEDDTPAEPEPADIALLLADGEALAKRRQRLSSLSCFMAALCEPIARRANKEDRATGRFWEGRFRSQAVLDEAALLACSIYIDLNPIRAGLADTPETSEFTAAFERIAARQHDARESAGHCQAAAFAGEEKVSGTVSLCIWLFSRTTTGTHRRFQTELFNGALAPRLTPKGTTAFNAPTYGSQLGLGLRGIDMLDPTRSPRQRP